MAVTFEEFIMQCCKAKESNLRKWVRKILPRYGFTIKEDSYLSERVSKDDSFKDVHNLLAIRGAKPKVCLVAHTDICRDHNSKTPFYGNPNKIPAGRSMVIPTIKKVEVEEEDGKCVKRIIQDKNCEWQVGGDDRLGVAINLWVALNTDYPLGICLTTDEEVGLKSARKIDFAELREFPLCVQTDRGNHSHELVTKIGSTILCDYETVVRLLEIAFDMGKPRKVVTGAGTDVAAMRERKVIQNAVNMTCGYHSSYSDGPNEYIDIEESRDTMKYVSSIVRAYEMPKLGGGF